ncbi:metal-sulfur cluster assembly factor [Microvirga sp. CF3016]|uniref:metal-sulfur cluster assembly factor n=1 Tax=Microvirga sp. CF3016 TaxID=3110181 RepID=UPI002E77D2CA|nr:metal-sulfur cluster assembly factor [Microvirga sp. CF3016]MEE1609844.1 metal-sulfur cluster assembly factor [Microvirga sp. CF3016]
MGINPKRQHTLDPDVLACLADVLDPEIGLSVVDLGLVYQASRASEAVEVALTLTTRACPLGEMIVEEARERLAHRFQDASRIDVRLVWDPAWNPDFITARGQELLGHTRRSTF